MLCLELEESGKDKVLDAIAELEKQDNVIYAGPDYVLSVCATTPNDYASGTQWAAEIIDLPSAWDITTGSTDVAVAVIDSGIYGYHPDLASRIDVGMCRDFSNGGEVSTGIPYDTYGHGTFVAGIIGAAGNHDQNNDVNSFLPANYELPNLITVGSSSPSDQRGINSNYGSATVDIFAPGQDVYSTTSTGGYGISSGTSFATPYVAGVAALLLSKYPYLTAAEMKRSILENAEIVYNIYGAEVFVDLCTSGGRLNAYDVLSNPKHTHTYTYVNIGILEGHDYICTACGNSVRERHTWSTSGSIHRCVKCGVESSYRPYAYDDFIEE